MWDLLVELGYDTDGLYVGLGIGDYSDQAGHYARRFASDRGLRLVEVDLRQRYDYDIPTAAATTGRVPCSACGLSKRHLFDRAAVDGNYDALVTGHNLDDEAAVLYGNTLRWQVDYLQRQRPVLPAGRGFPRKVKPLVRLTERETAAYCVLRGIDYLVDECPMAAGNKHVAYKEALNGLEVQSPGSKTEFYFGFLARMADRLEDEPTNDSSDTSDTGARRDGPTPCGRCGSPCDGEICSFCRLVDRTAGAEPVPVHVLSTRAKATR